MLKQKRPKSSRSSHIMGLMFLIPGLIWGMASLIAGMFDGAAMGFCTFAVLFGAFTLLTSRDADME